ncbi:tetratricopeptide repeat protein [Streptomyces sp. NPDC052012]|uniref:tetratricopeptide repeat protein n=1 Tax=Streptomyces sp. NPDC052012 TaxID=3155051 RepID=UPI00344B6ECC
MARLSREKKREHEEAAHAPDPAAVPIDVHVPLPVAGTGADAGVSGAPVGAPGGASVGGVPVVAGAGEEIQQAVLNRLHRIALASGHAVLATVHDERIGYVVPLRVEPDGSSHLSGEPLRMGSASAPAAPRAGHDKPTHLLRHVPEPAPATPQSAPPSAPAPATPPAPVTPSAPAPEPTSAPEPVRDVAPTFPLRAVPEPQGPSDSAPTFRLRPLPEPADAVPPGTVAPPTGAFGPPPPMDARPHPAPAPESGRSHEPPQEPDGLGPDPKPTPPRGFDAVAEAVLGDEPLAAPGEAQLAEPMGRINDAVRAGRIDTAARLAEQTVTEASATLGPEHPEVLRLRELTAYIAYLAGEPVRAFRLSLDLAAICRRTGDAEAAYGNVRSAATAWRAVRDPQPGLELGGELITLWTELAAEGGAAADEIEELESARARMGRLTERARRG